MISKVSLGMSDPVVSPFDPSSKKSDGVISPFDPAVEVTHPSFDQLGHKVNRI